MAEVYASPTLLGKRQLRLDDPCEASPFTSGCKRRRSFDPGQAAQETPWQVHGFDVGSQAWGRGGENTPIFTDGFGGGMAVGAVTNDRTGGRRPSGAGEGREGDRQAELAAKEAEIQKLRDCVMEKDRALRGVVEENYKLKHACGQAENTVAVLENDTKILKRGIQVQQQKCAKLEEEVGNLRAFASRAMEHVNRLEQANRSLCFRIMQAGGSCNDFIQPPPPPDVF